MKIGPNGEGRWVAMGMYVREVGLPLIPVHPAGTPTAAQALGLLGPWTSDCPQRFGGLLPRAFWAANDPRAPGETNPAEVLNELLPGGADPELIQRLKSWITEEVPKPPDGAA